VIELAQIVIEPKHMPHVANDVFGCAFPDSARGVDGKSGFARRDFDGDRFRLSAINHANQFPLLSIQLKWKQFAPAVTQNCAMEIEVSRRLNR
jgi:hypothetical protein